MTILISGAGIGGLTTALCLLKANHKVRVFEKSKRLDEIGAGLQLGANALRVFQHLDLLEKIQHIAVAPDSLQFRDYRSGKILSEVELGERYLRQYQAPYLHIHRADLQRILLEELKRLDPDCLHLGCEINTYQEYSDHVVVDNKYGEIKGSCLIAADGIRSQLRTQLLGEYQPQFTGHIAWRGMVPAQQFASPIMDKVTQVYVGPKKHLVLYYVRQQQLVNLVGVVENSEWNSQSWVEKGDWRQFREDFSGWYDTVDQLIENMDKQQCYRWGLFNHQPFTHWSSDRVTLLGDAAHATLPFLASGAAMAIEDARILQRSICETSTIAQGLQRYQRNRMQRTAKIQRRSSAMAQLYHISNPTLRHLAFKAAGVGAYRQEKFLTEYDPNTVRLVY